MTAVSTETAKAPNGAAPAARRATQPKSTAIQLQRVGRKLVVVRVIGTSPYIMNKFSEKAARMMLDRQMGIAVAREHKDPEALFRGAMHIMQERAADGSERWGIPAVSFKAAMVGAARLFPGTKLTMTSLKTWILVHGEPGSDPKDRNLLVPIEGPPPVMRQDHVRNETGVADIRFRPEFSPWSCTLKIVYIGSLLTPTSVVNLVDAAGTGGVGEWRPASKESQTGMYGTFVVDDKFEVQVTDL